MKITKISLRDKFPNILNEWVGERKTLQNTKEYKNLIVKK